MKNGLIVFSPRSHLIYCILIGFLFMLVPTNCFSQSGTITGSGSVTYNSDGSVKISGSKTFTSHVVGTNESVDNMLQLDVIHLYSASADLTGGIKAQMDQNGSVVLSLYSYSSTSSTKKGSLLYRVKSQTTSTTSFVGNPEQVTAPFGTGTINSNLIKSLVEGCNAWIVNKSRVPEDINLFYATMACINNGHVQPTLETSLNNKLKGNNFKLTQPVIMEVSVQNATIMNNGLKCPGLVQKFNLADYFDSSRSLSVQVKVNGVLQQTYKAGNVNPNPINLKMGDDVSYEVTYRGSDSPVIEGVPGVWIARFAGDLMYYCTPSIQPNEFNPWIGYDSRVHNMQLRNYKGTPNFQLKVPDWSKNGNVWSWSWTAQRRMDANKVKYSPSHVWIKYKTLKGGAKQRNNQREGLNIQFLEYWQEGAENSDFRDYQGSAKYVMGFDDDELFYLNSQYHDAIHHPPLTGGGIAKLDSIPSRGMPEGYDQIYDESTGYPAQGFPLNMVISAYKKNREWKLNNNESYSKNYDGYEIQDLGTDDDHPDGNGTGNNKAPGIIFVKAGGQVVTIKMNVTSPLNQDKGFYGMLEGNRWPAYFEKNVPYTLSGLQNLSVTELDKISLSYQGSDALGNLVSQVKNIKDLSSSEKSDITSTGKWTATFDNITPTYCCITAYYQRTSSSNKVIIAGKELKPLFMLFLGEKNLEGKGLGAKIWLNDFRDTRTDEYNILRKFGNKNKYMKPDVRTYTFPVGTTTTFTAWDGDPHLTYDPGIEWFLSSRTLAKRIPDNVLDGTAPGVVSPYMKYYINGSEQTAGRQGKDFTYTWNTPGTYTLRVVYRIDGGLTAYQHKIKIVNYPSTPKTLGKIVARDLTSKEAQWLNLTSASNYRIFEVQDVYSQYMYKDGPRANSPYVNRWADYNDYASKYEWNRSAPAFVDGFINSYNNLDWFWSYWALHYSSNWRDNLPNGLPPYVGNNQVTRVFGTELDRFATPIANLFKNVTQAKWQYTVPLVSFCDFQGDRMRTNPSCLYDLKYMFNNNDGAFTGNVVLPDDPSKIQAPDITDDQKDKMEFYYDLKSGKKTVLDISGQNSIYVSVRNIYGSKDIFIAQTTYAASKARNLLVANETISIEEISISPSVIYKNGNVEIFVNSNKEQTANISVYSISGKLIDNFCKNISIGENCIIYNIGPQTSGLYLMHINVNDQNVLKKIIVK